MFIRVFWFDEKIEEKKHAHISTLAQVTDVRIGTTAYVAHKIGLLLALLD